MHSILWASIWVSAGVAIITTVLIEFLFKPGLEARKDRILENSQERRQALKDIKRSHYLLIRLTVYGKGVKDGSVPLERFLKTLAEFSECAIRPYGIIDPPRKVSQEWADTMFAIHQFAVAPEKRLAEGVAEGFPIAFARLKLFHDYFTTAKWRIWRRRKLIRKIKSPTPPDNIKRVLSRQTDLPLSHMDLSGLE